MERGILAAGIVILVLSVAGFSFSQQQQGVLEQSESALEWDTTDWSLVQTVSLAGIVLGAILTIIGLIPSDVYRDRISEVD